MRRVARYAAGALLAAAVAAGTAALSRVPWAPAGGDAALLRLSWRLRGERVERCRRVPPEELAKQPAHMRREEVCEGRVLPYVLRVSVDGRTLVDDTVHAVGARGDRPLYVFRELPLAPGAHRVSIRFDRADADSAPAPDSSRAAPARLALDQAARLDAGEVLLVTYDDDRRALVPRRPARRP